MEASCRLWGLGLEQKAPCLSLPSSAVVFFRGASCHPAVWLSVNYEGTCLPGHWIHQCLAPRGQCCLPVTHGPCQPCWRKGT